MQRAAVGPATDILNNYVMARMMWNVSLDSRELTEEWLAGYGPLHNRSVAHPFLLAAFHSKFTGEQYS